MPYQIDCLLEQILKTQVVVIVAVIVAGAAEIAQVGQQTPLVLRVEEELAKKHPCY